MKLLITSVGRRVELIQAFRGAAERLGQELVIYGADITDTAPALQFCDVQLLVPRVSAEEYIPSLIEYCKDNEIDALIPTIDPGLQELADTGDRFGATRVLISAPDKISICRDKRRTAEYLTSIGLCAPKTTDDYLKYDGGFPAFIKPKNGSSSINAYKVNSPTELRDLAGRVPDYIVQPYIDGVEYTIDVLCDFDGNPIFITPRIRLAVRSGEVLKTRVDQNDAIISEIQTLVAHFRPRGQISVQLIRDRVTGKNYYIEINPRFGGGAPLSIKAGADSAEAVLRMLRGEKIEYRPKAAENGATFSRFDQSVRVDR